MDPQIHQNLGELRGRLGALEDRMQSMERDIDMRLDRMERMSNEKLDAIKSNLDASSSELKDLIHDLQTSRSEIRGGWKAIGLLSVMVTTLGAGIAWLIDHFGK